MPIPQSLRDDLAARLHASREAALATLRARTGLDPEGDEPPVISPRAHLEQNDDAPTAEMIAHDEEHLAEHETMMLNDIDAAIGRLDAGTYGICMSCGCEIPEQRLLATPTVQTCVPCQERIEQEDGTGRGPTM
jgi:DnaK suppressor protein